MLRRQLSRRGAVTVLALAGLVLAAPALAGDYDALKGKEIRAVIGGKPGAGTDVMGRAFYAAMGRLLPDTTIHVQTINGGAGAAAVKEMVEASGSLITIGIFGNGPIYSELLSEEGLPFDISKLQWLGSLADGRRVLSMRKALGPANFETLRNLDRQPITPSSSAGAPNHIETLLINAITGSRLKVIPGFEDAQIETMLMAGDADVRLAGTFQIKPLIDSGDMVPVMRVGDGSYPPEMLSLPTLADVALPTASKDLVLLMETLNRLGRPYAAAPGTAPEVVAALRAAFPVAMADSAVKELLEAESLMGGATGGAELQAALESLLTNAALKATVQKGLACGKALSEDPKATCG